MSTTTSKFDLSSLPSGSNSVGMFGRYNPQPRLETQPAVVLGMITRNLGTAGFAWLGQANHSYQAMSNAPGRIAQQKLQWDLMMQAEEWSTSFSRNEMLIRKLGGQTVDLSPEEERLWIAARRSIDQQPTKLSEEERAAYIQQLLPKLHRALTVPPSESTPEDWALLQSLFNLFGYGAGNHSLLTLRVHVGSYSLSALVYALGDFKSFLEIFAIDGERFQTRRVGQDFDVEEELPGQIQILPGYDDNSGSGLLKAMSSFLGKGRKSWTKMKVVRKYVFLNTTLDLEGVDAYDPDNYDPDLTEEEKRAQYEEEIEQKRAEIAEEDEAQALFELDPNFGGWCTTDDADAPRWTADEAAKHLMLFSLGIAAFDASGLNTPIPFAGRNFSFQPGAYRILPPDWVVSALRDIVWQAFSARGSEEHYKRTIEIGITACNAEELRDTFFYTFIRHNVRLQIKADGSLSYPTFSKKEQRALSWWGNGVQDRILWLAGAFLSVCPELLEDARTDRVFTRV